MGLGSPKSGVRLGSLGLRLAECAGSARACGAGWRGAAGRSFVRAGAPSPADRQSLSQGPSVASVIL